MRPESPFRFAVISDAHFHSLSAHFGFAGFSGADRPLVMRPLGDVARAPRVFNEAEGALVHALDRIAGDGIRDVILLGDYSDDGQAETLRALEALLDGYRSAHGLRFHAVPGNHDIFGENGRHRRKRFLGHDGETVLVTSDPAFEPERGASRIVSDRMYCAGYPENLPRDCGFFGSPGALHWETPFGTDPDPAMRRVPIEGGGARRLLMDASYLVEPHPGVWWLMIDANVFVPLASGDDGLADSTAAGWNAILIHRAALLDWIADVAARAARLEKTLVAFSHYPVLDPLDGTVEQERAMMAPASFHARIPGEPVACALHAAGVRLHVSGHVHVNDTAQWLGANGQWLANVAVPSLVAFPAAWKRFAVTGSVIDIDTVSLDAMPLDPALMQAYAAEHRLTGSDTGGMREARTYGEFLSAHLAHVSWRRYLKREWPSDMAELLRQSSLAVLTDRAGLILQGDDRTRAEAVGGLVLLADWYRLRNGSDLAFRFIPADRLALYRRIVTGVQPADADDLGARVRLFFATLARHLDGLPTRAIRVDAMTGALADRAPSMDSDL